MFHHDMIDLEAELKAKEQSKKGFSDLPLDCSVLLQFVKSEIGLHLGDLAPKDWKGWLCYERNKNSLVVCRGAAYKIGVVPAEYRAGFDVPNGLDSIRDFERSFDVTPPQELDHLILNFGGEQENPKVFLWYGENIAPYKLIFVADVEADPLPQLTHALTEACIWILKRPKGMTLREFLNKLKRS